MVTNDDFYHEMGDDVDHPTVDKSLVNDSSKHEPKSRLNISNEVEKRKEPNGETSLYYESQKIGQVLPKGRGYLYEMSEGFEFDNETFYKEDQNKKREYPKSYVEGCDMGWC
ncbi:DUF2553 family protein [Salipaludibacillus keqinensis]|nr:DUF2553 family protein [Salipaludibacillus keqinensis]